MRFLRSSFALLLLLLGTTRLSAQITDNFNDGDFTQNPAWQGDGTNFAVNSGVLQLVAPDAGTSVLTVGGNIADSSIWNLNFRLAFSPSGSNLLRIYLLADQAGLAAANGYFLEMGETGSLDAIRLYRQDAGTKTLLATGQTGLVAVSPDITLRIKRTVSGSWDVLAASGTGALQPQFTLTDATYTGGINRFFGFQCVYTTSNKDKFFFDNISILPDIADTQAPVLVSAQVENASQITVNFNEPLEAASAALTGNYSIAGAGTISAATLSAGKTSITLNLATPLTTGNYTVQTNQVADEAGNISAVQMTDFQYVSIEVAAEFDILINEIMPDPTPSVGLPEVEWLELFNRSAKSINLNTLRLDDGGIPVPLPSFVLQPNAYVLLSSTAGAAALAPAVPGVVAMPGFPSLNNDADVLTLRNSSDATIDLVSYNVAWHTATVKKNGGWSLERINPATPCLGGENWQSCPVLPGGTPGAANASLQNIPDTQTPRLLSAYPESATLLRLTFSEGLDKSSVQNGSGYLISPVLAFSSAVVDPTNPAVVLLTLEQAMQPQQVYTLTLTASIQDCSGNSISTADTVFVGLPEKPAPQDIVVNEVMFNPATGGARYIEFYNRSQKIFSWEDFFVANFAYYNGPSIEPIGLRRLLLPGQYDVFTTSPNDINTRFRQIKPGNVLQNPLPSLADDAGNVTLYWSKNGTDIVVDSFDYFREWHNALFSDSDRNGVALERISTENPTNLRSNWTSASPITTGAPGTPTLPNSQTSKSLDNPADGLIQLAAERLSPDGDGFEDFLDIRYTLPNEGYAATMRIFDADGLPVQRLVRQELLGRDGALRWDGDLEDGTRARPGIYVLWLEIFSPTGDVQRVKKAFAVVSRF